MILELERFADAFMDSSAALRKQARTELNGSAPLSSMTPEPLRDILGAGQRRPRTSDQVASVDKDRQQQALDALRARDLFLQNVPLLVLGGVGSGKSAVMANFVQRYREKATEAYGSSFSCDTKVQ